MNLWKKALPWIAAGVAGLVATPAVAVAAASVDWYDWLSVPERQRLLTAVARAADRLHLGFLGCALRRQASYLPYDQAAREYLRHVPPAELAAVLAEVRARSAQAAPAEQHEA